LEQYGELRIVPPYYENRPWPPYCELTGFRNPAHYAYGRPVSDDAPQQRPRRQFGMAEELFGVNMTRE